MKKFTLEIELGNEAMSDAWDLCEALRKLKIKPNSVTGDDGFIFDRNGNKVGKWEIK